MTPGRIFVVLILAVGVVGTAVQWGYGLCAPLISRRLADRACMVADFLFTVGIASGAQARSLRASVGDIFEEHFEIYNTSRIPKLWLEVANEATIPNVTGSRVLTFLRGRQKRIYTSRTWLTNRGGFSLGPTTITSGDPFGIFRVSKKYPAIASLVVVPLIFPCGGISFASRFVAWWQSHSPQIHGHYAARGGCSRICPR